jgi:hypothetical protein
VCCCCCLQVRELVGLDLTAAKRAELALVSEDWMRGKAVKDRRLMLLVRHVDFASLDVGCARGPRLFVAESGLGGPVQGFLLLDPLCKGGRRCSGCSRVAPGGGCSLSEEMHWSTHITSAACLA